MIGSWPVSQNVKVDHHPAAGHWFAAGLSPNISGRNRVALHNSPHYPVVPYTHAGSYGSLGSHGSYNDGTGLGSSYGSYGDNTNMLTFYSPVGPSGMNIHAQGGGSVLGTSPDARRRIIQLPPGNGLGVSPVGNFVPMSLGTSPSQFTPPSSYNQVSSVSPGQYGPSSPARGNCHGSPLGKGAAVSQFNRKKSWGYSGSVQSHESSSPSHWQGHCTDATISSQAEENSPVLGGSTLYVPSNSNVGSWRQQQGGSGITSGYPATHNISSSSTLCSNMQFPYPKRASHNKPEASNSLPDPGDWDPNYR
ncbi:unnamed protein product [Ilex paraguariensis]|uniref:Uncharacterized protein n=1 Tax=Ilex paraguariensis TaxID=185542 RepID=A0ABC8TDJ0_9AQUA